MTYGVPPWRLEWVRRQVRERDRSECWTDGPDCVVLNGKRHRLVRAAYVLDTGEQLTTDELVISSASCTHRCWNPDHLVKGDKNVKETITADRGMLARGDRHPHNRLTDAQVLAIYHDNRPSRLVARDYPVSAAQVRMIRTGARKAWITGHQRSA